MGAHPPAVYGRDAWVGTPTHDEPAVVDPLSLWERVKGEGVDLYSPPWPREDLSGGLPWACRLPTEAAAVKTWHEERFRATRTARNSPAEPVSPERCGAAARAG